MFRGPALLFGNLLEQLLEAFLTVLVSDFTYAVVAQQLNLINFGHDCARILLRVVNVFDLDRGAHSLRSTAALNALRHEARRVNDEHVLVEANLADGACHVRV